jgi:hypothetical protein
MELVATMYITNNNVRNMITYLEANLEIWRNMHNTPRTSHSIDRLGMDLIGRSWEVESVAGLGHYCDGELWES